IVALLAARYRTGPESLAGDVADFLTRLRDRGLLRGWATDIERTDSPPTTEPQEGGPGLRPLGLLAELTHRCPLRCPYCSNPTELAPAGGELATHEWGRVLAEAAELGVLHVHFSGGEPLLRRDLPALVRSARREGLYTNLLTSAVGLTR